MYCSVVLTLLLMITYANNMRMMLACDPIHIIRQPAHNIQHIFFPSDTAFPFFLRHGVFRGADTDMDAAVMDLGYGEMFFRCSLCGIGRQLAHWRAAAVGRYTGFIQRLHQAAAMGAIKKFRWLFHGWFIFLSYSQRT